MSWNLICKNSKKEHHPNIFRKSNKLRMGWQSRNKNITKGKGITCRELSSKTLVVSLLVPSLHSPAPQMANEGKTHVLRALFPSIITLSIPSSFLLVLSCFLFFLCSSDYCRLVPSVLLMQGCHLSIISFRSFSSWLHVRRCNIVASNHRVLGVSWYREHFFYREDGILRILCVHDRMQC